MDNHEYVKLKSISKVVKGKQPEKLNYSGKNEHLYLNPDYLRGKGNAIIAKPAKNSIIVNDGEIIVLWDGSNAGEFFKSKKGIVASTMAKIEHSNEYKSGFLFYALKLQESYLKGQTNGSGIPHVDQEVLLELNIMNLDRTYQCKIAEVLETVDSAIEKTEELIAKQERIKTGLMQDLLAKGIDEYGNIRSEETHEFKESPIGRIPAEWDTILIKDVTHVKQGLQIAIEKRFKEEGINRYRYITVQYLNNPKKYTEYIEAPSEGLICNSDDILFTRTGNTGQIVTGVKGVFHNNFFKVDYIKDKLVKDFLIMFLEWRRTQDKIRDLAGTTTIPDLNHGDFYGLDFNLPSMKEQNRIVDAFSSLEVKITLEKFELNKLHRIKTALMQDLLSGRVRVKSLLDDLEVTS